MAPESDVLVVQSPAMAWVEARARLYATVPNPIALIGPVGSGKSSLARWIHRISRRAGDLVEIACGGQNLEFSSDALFGHAPGAFTGANSWREGLLAQAPNGSVLFDDLALLPMSIQESLLRVVETGRYRPNGVDAERTASCRFLFATTEDPSDLVTMGRLLPDLDSRIGEFRIVIPPLAQRPEDIMPIAARRAQRSIMEMNWKAVARFDPDAVISLSSYSWPRNVRELESVIDLAVVHAGVQKGEVIIRRAHLPERFHEIRQTKNGGGSLNPSMVEATLLETGGNQSEAARRLKVHRNTIRKYAPPRRPRRK